MGSYWIDMRGCMTHISFTNMGLSSCCFNFNVISSNGGEFTWNAEPILDLHFLGTNFMPYY